MHNSTNCVDFQSHGATVVLYSESQMIDRTLLEFQIHPQPSYQWHLTLMFAKGQLVNSKLVFEHARQTRWALVVAAQSWREFQMNIVCSVFIELKKRCNFFFFGLVYIHRFFVGIVLSICRDTLKHKRSCKSLKPYFDKLNRETKQQLEQLLPSFRDLKSKWCIQISLNNFHVTGDVLSELDNNPQCLLPLLNFERNKRDWLLWLKKWSNAKFELDIWV